MIDVMNRCYADQVAPRVSRVAFLPTHYNPATGMRVAYTLDQKEF
jgi:hypothetical protein